MGGASAPLDTYYAPGRAVVVIDADPRFRDRVARGMAPSFRVADFPDVEAAVGRTTVPPAAVVVGEAGTAKADPAGRLRREAIFRQVPIVRCVTGGGAPGQGEADAVVDRAAPVGDLVEAIGRLVTGRVEESWDRLPANAQISLRRTLALFRDIGRLMEAGSPLAFDAVTQACTPILDVVKCAGQGFVFRGLKDHDEMWYVHCLRVSTLLALFGHTIGLGDDELMILASAGLVHDFGKAALPRDLLNKVGPLDARELEMARGHVAITVDYLRRHSDAPRQVVAIAEQHQERLDGSGYPRGLANEQVNDLARMTAIVDVFAALTERRSYRAAMSPYQALEVMQANLAAKLDQRLVRLFRTMLLEAA